jgi:hypothetical protein
MLYGYNAITFRHTTYLKALPYIGIICDRNNLVRAFYNVCLQGAYQAQPDIYLQTWIYQVM